MHHSDPTERPTLRYRPGPSQRPTRPAPPIHERESRRPTRPAPPLAAAPHEPSPRAPSPRAPSPREPSPPAPHRVPVLFAFAGATLLGLVLAATIAPWIVDRVAPIASAQTTTEIATHAAAPEPPAPATSQPAGRHAAPTTTPIAALPADGAPVSVPARTTGANAAPTSLPIAALPAPAAMRGVPLEPTAEPRAAVHRAAPPSTSASPGALARLAPVRVAPSRRRGGELGERSIPELHAPRRVSAPLDPDAVRSVVRSGQHRMRQCYVTAMRRHGMPTDVELRMTVDVDHEGFVSAIDVDGPDFGGIVACLRRTAIRWRFPASRSGGRVPIPLAFRAVE